MPVLPAPLPSFEPALRVLVADDNELNQLVVCRALEEWNVEPTLADNGRQAVELGISQPFDAVLMDIQMPEMDGYEATRALRSHPHLQHLPIIGLTASASAQDQAQALAAGMNTTLAKPFDPALLHASLVRFTSGQQPVAVATRPALVSTPVPLFSSTRTAQPNWEVLEELAAGNESFINQIVTTFLQQAPPLYQQLVACPAQEVSRLAQLAHKLKGQVVYFGLPSLEQYLEKLETPHLFSAPDNVQQLISLIGQHLSALYPHLEARRRNH